VGRQTSIHAGASQGRQDIGAGNDSDGSVLVVHDDQAVNMGVDHPLRQFREQSCGENRDRLVRHEATHAVPGQSFDDDGLPID